MNNRYMKKCKAINHHNKIQDKVFVFLGYANLRDRFS